MFVGKEMYIQLFIYVFVQNILSIEVLVKDISGKQTHSIKSIIKIS